jgi:lipopolysaccharide/colanic/teichoic acid biosynthesis glycosyltransferase
MVHNAESLKKDLESINETDGPVFKLRDDPRLTKVGRTLRRFSVDELPQFFNVLKNDMAIVGPRPLAKKEMKFNPVWRDIRLKVKPGITGEWQINSRSNSSFKDWIINDIYYVNHRSILLDLKIILRTLSVIINSIGSY